MGRREWFIDHNDNGYDAAFTAPEPTYDWRVGFMVRPDEDECATYLTLYAKDAIKLGKALVKAGKKAKEARGS